MLIRLDREGGHFQEASSFVGESTLISPVPSIRCAFDRLGPAILNGFNEGSGTSLTVTCFLPGRGKENFEVRPIVFDEYKPAFVASDRFRHQMEKQMTTAMLRTSHRVQI
jgi:hypothetical protein